MCEFCNDPNGANNRDVFHKDFAGFFRCVLVRSFLSSSFKRGKRGVARMNLRNVCLSSHWLVVRCLRVLVLLLSAEFACARLRTDWQCDHIAIRCVLPGSFCLDDSTY